MDYKLKKQSKNNNEKEANIIGIKEKKILNYNEEKDEVIILEAFDHVRRRKLLVVLKKLGTRGKKFVTKETQKVLI